MSEGKITVDKHQIHESFSVAAEKKRRDELILQYFHKHQRERERLLRRIELGPWWSRIWRMIRLALSSPKMPRNQEVDFGQIWARWRGMKN